MLTLILFLSLLSIAAYVAYRYSKTEADPDIAMFTLAGFTGAWYGRDFIDCKTPLVHLWFYGITRMVGARIERVKFVHHFLVGASGAVYFLISKDFFGGLAFTVMINAGWLFAFTGNVGQVPAALSILALSIVNPWISCTLLVLAVLYEPKLLPSMTALVILRGLYLPALAWLSVGIVCAAVLYVFKRDWFDWLIEANITIPKRMNAARPGLYSWCPWFTSQALVYVLPWIVAAVYAKPDPLYWIAPALYLVFISLGRVIRPHHLLPIIPWVAAAGIDPAWVIGLFVVDMLSSGLYLGDNWARFYRMFIDPIRESKEAGLWLYDKPGMVWVTGMHTEVYTYAEKFPPYGLVEQIEINSVATERRAAMLQLWKATPPDWVVETPEQNGVKFDPRGFEKVISGMYVSIWRRR